MIQTTDIFVKLGFNYQGEGRCQLKNGICDINDNIKASITSDYDEEENDSIVCINTEIRDTALPDVLTAVNDWVAAYLPGFEFVSSEVHCIVKQKKINNHEAHTIKVETGAWQLDTENGEHTFVYFDDDPSKLKHLQKTITARISKFWVALDSNINV